LGWVDVEYDWRARRADWLAQIEDVHQPHNPVTTVPASTP
jgi:hypothetical protein